jgi:hypothetical protein
VVRCAKHHLGAKNAPMLGCVVRRGMGERQARRRQNHTRQPVAKNPYTGKHTLSQVTAGKWEVAVPLVMGSIALHCQRRHAQVMREAFEPLGLLEHLPKVTAAEQNQPVHTVGTQLNAFPHMQAKVVIRSQRSTGI